MPIAKNAPMPMKAQGLASYSVCGVQERMPRSLQPRAAEADSLQ